MRRAKQGMPNKNFNPIGPRPIFRPRAVSNDPRDAALPTAASFYYGAVHWNTLHGDLPHPVRARNLGLLTAWRNWLVGQDYDTALLPQVFCDESMPLRACSEVQNRTVDADPARKQGQLQRVTHILDVTYSVLFWSRSHTLVELTRELQRVLMQSDLGEDIPASLLRLPAPVCYISFGPTVQQGLTRAAEGYPYDHVEGTYVMETAYNGQRTISLVPVYVTARTSESGPQKLAVSLLELNVLDDRQTLMDAILDACADGNHLSQAPHYLSIIQFCAKVFLYMALTETMQAEERPYTAALAQLERVGPKKAAKLRRQVDKLYDRILLGPSEALSQDRGETAPHWRRGHFRTQPHGPQNSLRKVIFIAPVLVRADRLAAGAGNTATKPNRPNLNT